jgi:valyl-tRNA synthetase
MAQIATSTQDVRLPVDLVDPHSGRVFEPEFITSPSGHIVPAPIQRSPADPDAEMVTVYGLFSGETATETRPAAKNTSSRFDVGRNFANKTWNAARFALGRISAPEPPADLASLSLADRWMLSRVAAATEAMNDAFGRYRFHAAADAVYDIVWRDFCDWYLEAIKPTVAEDPRQQQVLLSVLDAVLRLLHPMCPFVTETIWPHVRKLGPRGVPGLNLPDADLLATAAWPAVSESLRDEAAERDTSRLQSLVGEIRRLRSDNDVPAKAEVTLLVGPSLQSLAEEASAVLAAMCNVKGAAAKPDQRPAGALAFVFEGDEVLIDLAGAVDPEAERSRLSAKLDALTKSVAGLEGRMKNPAYVEKAPAHLVEETRSQLAQAQSDLAATRAAIEAIA